MVRIISFLCLALLSAGAMTGCGDDGAGGDVPPTPTIGGGATASGPSPTPPPLSSAAQFLYTVAAGDTLAEIADAFDGVAGTGESLSETDLATLNQTRASLVVAGMRILVPLVLSDADAMLPDASIEDALGIDGSAGSIVLLQPSAELRSGYLGLLALHSVELAGGEATTEGIGYRMEYYRTDRPAIRAGVIDEDAHFDAPLFTVAGGSLADALDAGEGGELYRFERDGVSYAVAATADAELSAERIAGMLVTADER